MRWEADVRLADHTRYRIGGPASRFGRVRSVSDLRDALQELNGSPHRVLGWGANLLVADGGVRDAVLVLEGELDWLRLGSNTVEAGAGAGIPSLVGEARRAARTGFSFLEAVPGSVGGALRMNAGSPDTGIWDRVLWVEAMQPDGQIVRLSPEEAAPAYRSVAIPEEWVFLGGSFAAPPGERETVEHEHTERRVQKVESQVYDLPSCGSTWKNPGPPWGSAWELVDRAGMRGAVRGGAQIAEKHCNFIANLGGAQAADVLWLMQETRRRVHDLEGLWLEPEIRMWGFTPEELAVVGGCP